MSYDEKRNNLEIDSPQKYRRTGVYSSSVAVLCRHARVTHDGASFYRVLLILLLLRGAALNRFFFFFEYVSAEDVTSWQLAVALAFH